MNYFELYPGDYLRDTARLTMLEHGAYMRLMLAYYSEEQPLPSDETELFVIACAMSQVERSAVQKVAARFFPLCVEDGLRHNKRADAEIAKAQKRIKIARANGSKRKPANGAGGISSEGYSDDTTQRDSQRVSQRDSQRDSQQVSQRLTHSGEALHTPHATSSNTTEASAEVAKPSEAARACLLMREAGCIQANPSSPDLIAALAEGITPEMLAHTAAEAIACGGKQNPFRWAIQTARGRHAAGPKPLASSLPLPMTKPRALWKSDRKMSEADVAKNLGDHLPKLLEQVGIKP